MAHTFSLENTFGAGERLRSDLQSAAQNREFNTLRLRGEEQRQDIAGREFEADQQRANTEKLLTGFQIMQNNPGVTPDVLDELGRSGIINPNTIPQMLQEATNSPETFAQKMADAESRIRLQLGQARQQPQFDAPRAGVDPTTGERVFGQIDPATGQSRTVEGLAPPVGGVSGPGAAERFFGSLTEGLPPEEQLSARRRQLGLEPRAVGSADITIAGDPELTGDVAESRATIAQRVEFGRKTGISRANTIDKGFESIQAINTNVRNLDKAIAAIDEGASTGAIESRFLPTIRKATVKLEQVQSLLGLDVVGGVTFGALSKGELDLALTVALPVGLQPAELRQWIVDKQAAQLKLRDYFAAQIDFLDQGGTIAGFLRQQQRGAPTEGAAGGTVIDFADLPP